MGATSSERSYWTDLTDLTYPNASRGTTDDAPWVWVWV
jgi:hypothetical protein